VRIDNDYVPGTDEYGGVAVQHGLRIGTCKVNAAGNLLNFEEVGLGTGSRRAGPGSSMPGKLQYRSPSQGSPHQQAKEVAAGGVPVHDMIVRMGMMVMGVAVMTRLLLHASVSLAREIAHLIVVAPVAKRKTGYRLARSPILTMLEAV
jgi:hypothetical protein